MFVELINNKIKNYIDTTDLFFVLFFLNWEKSKDQREIKENYLKRIHSFKCSYVQDILCKMPGVAGFSKQLTWYIDESEIV